MQINLSDTTHTLEIETTVAGNIDYVIGYIDITSTTVSNPIEVQGNITSAVTTIAVSAPSISTTRKIQYVNIFNRGASNTVYIKKDISGTEYKVLSTLLLQNETLRVIGDNIEVLDATGLLKKQSEGFFQGKSRALFKVSTAMEAANVNYCFSKDSGFPGAWSPGTPGINGRNTNGATSADNGSINVGTPSIGSWYLRDITLGTTIAGFFTLSDVLWINTGLTVTTTTAQSITQPTLPPRDDNGSTDGLGVFAGILVTTATTNAGAITNITLTYTNSDGVSGRTGTIASFPATAVIGTFVPFQLAAGDKGIRSIQSVTLGTSLVGGAISLICYNPVISSNITPGMGNTTYSRSLDIPLQPNHCLIPFWLATSTGAITIQGTVYFIDK